MSQALIVLFTILPFASIVHYTVQVLTGVSNLPGAVFAGSANQQVKAHGQPVDGVLNDVQRSHVKYIRLEAVNGVNLVKLVGNHTEVSALFEIITVDVVTIVNGILGDSPVNATNDVVGTNTDHLVVHFDVVALVRSNVDSFIVFSSQHYVLFVSCESGSKGSNCHQSYESNSKNFLCVHEYSP